VKLLRRPGPALAALLFLLLGAAFLTQVVPYRQIIDSHRQVEEAKATLAALEDENETLQGDAEALLTDAEVEKLAREKLGYVRPGETAYVVLDPPEEQAEQPEPAPPPETSDPEEGGTWVDWIWDFLTGGDLEP
jgi:cell division protein FtsB